MIGKNALKWGNVMLEIDDCFTVTDIKQCGYCPRIIFYERCLPHIRPRTAKMDAGHTEHKQEQNRAARRNLSAYEESEGERFFDVRLESPTLGLRGAIDELVRVRGGDVFPVDYKLTHKISPHHRHQLTAYALLLEDCEAISISFGFIYLIPSREMIKVTITSRLRNEVLKQLELLRHIVHTEHMPPPAKKRSYCVNCEFRRFCNDVL